MPTTEGRFLLYPAHFWPHKRHVLALEALSHFHRCHPEHQDLRLVLTGADKGNLAHVSPSLRHSISTDCVEFKGFVSDSELARLLRTATALLFPSALGNMNLPQLEAALVGTPVITDAAEAIRTAASGRTPLRGHGDDPPTGQTESFERSNSARLGYGPGAIRHSRRFRRARADGRRPVPASPEGVVERFGRHRRHGRRRSRHWAHDRITSSSVSLRSGTAGPGTSPSCARRGRTSVTRSAR